MRALLYTGEGRIGLSNDVKVRDPGPGEVIVHIHACGLCRSDLSVVHGNIPWPAPAVLGHEGAGVIEAVGAGVTKIKPGDHVVMHTVANCGHCAHCESGRPTHCRETLGNRTTPFSLGDGTPVSNFAATSAFAEYTVVKQDQVIVIGDDIPLNAACLIGCAVLTGVGAVLNRAKVRPGQTAAVFGVGGVGLNSIQALALSGASRIIAVDTIAEKRAMAEQFGATDFIDATQGDAAEQIRTLLPHSKTQTTGTFGSGGVDWTFECTGSPRALKSAVEALDWGGGAVIVGVPPHGSTIELPINPIAYVDRTITGTRYGSSRPHIDIPMYIDFYRQGRLKLDELITKEYPLADFEAAFADLEAGKLARGVLTF
jgi:S-(hydroxymethyl)glutathione dehydrogenase/alcohol dehydrogenase